MATQISAQGFYSTFSWTVGTTQPITSDYSVQWSDSKSGVDNPRWKEQVASLQPATTPFTASKRTVEIYEIKGEVRMAYPSPGQGVLVKKLSGFEGPPTFPSVLSTSASAAENAALKSLYNRLRAVDSEAQGLTILGELRQTIHMLRHPAEGVMKLSKSFLSQVEKSAKRNRKDIQKNLSGLYLEYVFGIVPFINDVKDVIEAIDSASRPKVTVVSGFGKDENIVNSTARTQIREIAFLESRTDSTETSVRYKVGLKLDTWAPSTDRLAESLGFTFQEFIPSIYELLPWSFLVDYFANIGDIISAVTYNSSKIAWSNRTLRVHNEKKQSYVADAALTKPIFPANYFLGVSGSGNSWTTSTTVDRSATMPAYPSFQVSVPGIGKKWVNMSALLAQNKSVLKLLHGK